MFEVICTGQNLNYGKNGEKRLINDSLLNYAVKNNVVYPDKIKYIGSQGRHPLGTGKPEALLPLKRVNLIRTIEMQNDKIDKLIKVFNNIVEVNKRYLELYKKQEMV